MGENGTEEPEAVDIPRGQVTPTPDQDQPAPVASATQTARTSWQSSPLVPAISALLGAVIGGFFSYLVATDSNQTQAEAALLARKQTDYAAYLAAETKLQGAAWTMTNFYERYEDSDINLLQQSADSFAEAVDKASSADSVVALTASPEVDKARVAIAQAQNGIAADFHALADDSKYRQRMNPDTMEHSRDLVEQLDHLFEEFKKAARKDTRADS